MRRLFVAVTVALAVVGVPAYASAAPFTFSLDVGNTGLSGYTGPFATVTVNLVSSTMATVTFDSLTNGSDGYLLGDGGSVAVNVNATSWTIGPFTNTNVGTGFTPGPSSDSGAGTEDGFGSFNQVIDSFDGFTHSSTQIVFDLMNTSGTWAASDAVLTANGSGYLAAAHIFVTSCSVLSACNSQNGALTTGFATGDGGTQQLPKVPEPATLTLLGTGLAATSRTRRRHGGR